MGAGTRGCGQQVEEGVAIVQRDVLSLGRDAPAAHAAGIDVYRGTVASVHVLAGTGNPRAVNNRPMAAE